MTHNFFCTIRKIRDRDRIKIFFLILWMYLDFFLTFINGIFFALFFNYLNRTVFWDKDSLDHLSFRSWMQILTYKKKVIIFKTLQRKVNDYAKRLGCNLNSSHQNAARNQRVYRLYTWKLFDLVFRHANEIKAGNKVKPVQRILEQNKVS